MHTARLTDGSEGLVHGDISPDSILLARSGRDLVAKLVGFGLARAFDSASHYGMDIADEYDEDDATGGELAFTSRPRLINNKYANPAVDVWAMAASLYFMLTGLPPRDFSKGVDPIGSCCGLQQCPSVSAILGSPSG